MATSIVGIVAIRQDNDGILRRSLERQAVLSRTLSDLQDAESSQRGLLLAGTAHFSRLYEEAAKRVEIDLAALDRSMVDEPKQLVWTTRLKDLARTRLMELATTLAASQSGNRAAVVASLQPRDDGSRMVETARAYIGEVAAVESSGIDIRRERSQMAGVLMVLTTAGLFALMTVLSLAAIREASRRERLARYLPGEIAALLADGAMSMRDGDQRHAAVAFVDMRGSTALAERLAPAEFMSILARYRGQVSEAARLASGMVDKFIGDGALVVFGLTGRPDSASADALRFADLLTLAIARDAAEGSLEPIRIGIGVHYGLLFCGVIGDGERQEFTVLGDTVNVAARLQEHSKTFGTTLLASNAALAAAREGRTGWTHVGALSLQGRIEPVEAFTRATSGSDRFVET